MFLRSVQIENYRAIRQGTVTLDQTTVLFGENDSGRSSVMEALLLILGSADEVFEARLKPFHFHRGPDGALGQLLITLQVKEEAPPRSSMPACMERHFPAKPGGRDFEFAFRARLDPATSAITHTWSLRDPAGAGVCIRDNDEVLHWLREMMPALYLRLGTLAESPAIAAGRKKMNPALESLEQRHRNLITGNTPDLFAELEQGAKAAQEVLKLHSEVFADAAPLMSAMASEILNQNRVSTAAEPKPVTAAHKIAMLLLLGAVLQLARRKLSPHARPVLIIENPESNLHPMTLAAVWRIIERIVWQKIVTTNSGTILASAPLHSLRRITRSDGRVTEWSVRPTQMSREALRRISYHLRSRRASAMFARCWLLVEGETEYWILPELARVCGYDFAAEGVACVEFAQCGLPPLAKLADLLGIAWHVLADGDEAGRHYEETALKLMGGAPDSFRKLTRLRERDIENCFWQQGFSGVIRRVAWPDGAPGAGSPAIIIRKAIERASKPYLALRLIEAVAARGPASIPKALREVIESCVGMARSGPSHAKYRRR